MLCLDPQRKASRSAHGHGVAMENDVPRSCASKDVISLLGVDCGVLGKGRGQGLEEAGLGW